MNGGRLIIEAGKKFHWIKDKDLKFIHETGNRKNGKYILNGVAVESKVPGQ